jgi:hypothetical protein
MLEALTNNLDTMTTDSSERHRDHAREPTTPVTNQACPPREREKSSADAAANDCPSLDRTKQKLNYGAPTDGGNGAQVE